MTALQRAAERLVAGCEQLARRAADRAVAWVRRGRRTDLTCWQAELGVWLRIAVLAGLAALLWRIIRATPVILWVIVALLLLAAWRLGRPVGPPPAPAAAALPKADAEDPPALAVADLIRLVREAMGTGPGVHTTALATHLTQTTGEKWSPAAVRAALSEAGIEHGPGARMSGVSYPSGGVRRTALPDPSPTPPVGAVGDVVSAGRPATTGAATPTATGPELQPGERGFECVDDPDRPTRTHVLWKREEVNRSC
ncbi:hypothetical protein [Streptomyces sp. NPDC050504]|uniref:hypothetical protein n=1 Tax=Streptomyces sp. NPDC050504 TaxID=3365618 RepID=UPI0037B0D3A2